MKLYHGTSHINTTKILKKGIKPRGRKAGHWGSLSASNPSCVYLTDAYAPYFAINATNSHQMGVVFEIDTAFLPEAHMLPDEDFLAQVDRLQKKTTDETLLETTEHYRNILHQWLFTDVWKQSLKFLGTCAFNGVIPPEAISRYAVFKLDRDPSVKGSCHMLMHFDPTISLQNYRYCASKYRFKTAHLFGDEHDMPEDEIRFWGGKEHLQFPRNGVTVISTRKEVEKRNALLPDQKENSLFLP